MSECLAQLLEIRLQRSEFLVHSAGFFRIQAGDDEEMKRRIVGFARIQAITVDFSATFGPERYSRKCQARIQFRVDKMKSALMVIVLAPGKIGHALRITLNLKVEIMNRTHLARTILLLTSQLRDLRMTLHGKGGRSKKMKSSDCSDKREVAEA